MKKYIYICISISVIIIGFIIYYIFLQGVDTRYAIKYSQIFSSYDIKQVDQYMTEDTIISYNGISKTYGQLRHNISVAFESKNFKMQDGSSYGSGDNKFINGVQVVNIQSYVDHNNQSIEVPIIMQLEKKGINKFAVRSLSSDSEFFGYLFFGK